jgi:hypothetical protein
LSIWLLGLKTGWKCAVNRTGKGYFVKGRSGNPGGRPKNPPEFAPSTGGSAGADRRTVGNLVIEARKFSGLAVDTLVELTRDNHTDSTRFAAATAPAANSTRSISVVIGVQRVVAFAAVGF